MPTTRRKSAGTAKGRSKAPAKPNQSKLAFHGPISKPTGHDTLDKKSAAAVEKAEKAEAPVAEPILIPEKSTAAATSAAATTTSDLDEEVFPPGLSTLELDEEEMEAWRAAVRKARGIGEARIEEYWEAKERERITPRVHQEGMSMHDKLLADWDVDSRYGPCGGIKRTQRWQRAHIRYDMQPPLEVLAVLLEENKAHPGKAEQSRMGSLMIAGSTD